MLRNLESALSGNLFLGFGLCVLLPIAIVIGSDHTSLNQAIMLDPYHYTAYIYDFQQTAERFGQTYYSERLAAILPDLVLAKLFGVETGYFISRLVLLFAASTSVFLIAKRFSGVLVAGLAVAWLLYTHWFLGGLFTTYVDGFAVVYLFCALACLLVPQNYRLLWHFFAGVFFLAAANSHLFALVTGGLFSIPWILLNRRMGPRWLIIHAVSVLAGMLVTYLILAIIYRQLMPGEAILWASAWNTTKWGVAKGGFANWWNPDLLGSIFYNGNYLPLVLPLTMLIAATAGWRGLRDSKLQEPLPIFLLYALLVLLFYLVNHYVLKGGAFYFYYTMSFQIPAVSLLLITVAGSAIETEPLSAKPLVLLITIMLMALWLLSAQIHNETLPHIIVLSVIGGLILLPLLFRKYRLTLLALSFVGVCSVIFFSVDGQPQRVRSPSSASTEAFEWDVYRAAIDFQRWVGEHVPTDVSVGFWYPDTGADAPLNATQSMFLWGYSKVTDWTTPYPKISDDILKQIRSKTFLVLLSTSEPAVSEGVTAIREAGLVFNKVEDYSFDGERFRFQATLLEKDH